MDSYPTVSLSPTQVTPSSSSSSSSSAKEEEISLKTPLKGNSSIPIRAPLSSDSDFETAIKVHGRSNSSSSSSSVSSFESEEGFVSGEDGFETASEKHFVADPDEENLELPMERDEIVPILVETGLGSFNSSLLTPKARVSMEDDDDDVDGSEVEDDGVSTIVRVPSIGRFEKFDGAVEAPKVGVLGIEEGNLGESSVAGDSGIAAEDSKMIKNDNLIENSAFVGSSDNGVLGSEGRGLKSEEDSILDLGSVESIGEKVPSVAEASDAALTVSKEDVLPENPEFRSSIATSENGLLVSEGISSLLEQNPVLDSGSVKLTGDRVPEVSNEVLVVTEEDNLPENPKSDVVVDPEITSQEKEVVETKDEVVEEKKSEEEAVETKDGVVEKKSEAVGDDLAVGLNSSMKESSDIDSKQQTEAENGGSNEGVEFPVEKVAVLTSENNQENPEIEELMESKVVEEDTVVESISGGNLLVETKSISLEPEGGGVGESEENQTSETKSLGLVMERTLSADVVSDHTPAAVEEEPDDLKLVEAGMEVEKVDDDHDKHSASEKNFETVTESAIETRALELQESKIEVKEVQKDDDVKNDGGVASQGDELKDVFSNISHTPESAEPSSIVDSEVIQEAEAEAELYPHPDYEEDEGSVSDEENEGLNFDSSETAEQIMEQLMRGSGVSFQSGAESSQDNSQRIDGQIMMDSDEEEDTDEEGEGKELFDSAALTALLKAATSAGPEGGTVTITSQDGSRLFSVERPAGLGSSIRSSKPASRQPNIFTPADIMVGGESENILSEEEKKKLEKFQLVRVKFLRLLHKLGHSPDDSIAGQVLYRMVLAAGRHTGQAFSLEAAKKTATQLEAEGSDDLDFSLNILVLGKTGVGKSATINSIFGEEKSIIDAFEPATTTVKEIIGTVGGVKIRVFDTPGLRSSVMEQAFNRKILSSVKKFTKKFPPDILLYVDRLDTQSRDLNDLPLLRSITNTLGSSIWRSAVVTLTHAASAPPDGPSGSPLSYEVFVAQRSHIVQQSIGQAVGDLRMMNPSLMNPVSLVENHPSCRKNREGQKILPNGQSWRPQLLLLCYSLKILSEVSSLSKPQDPIDHRKLFGFRVRAPPLPYLLSTLLQSRAHPKLPDDQGGENADSDVDLEDLSDSDQEDEEDEYDQLPPFKPLRKSQIAKLSKEQRKAYFDEYDYRVKLLQKKQLKEELKRMREMKKKGKGSAEDLGYIGEGDDQENGGPAAVPVPLPDMILPPSFDGDNPAYRYRFLEPKSQLLARPVLDTHGWDHDCGYDGVSLEENLAIVGRFPAGVAVQITKDKKEFNIHFDSSVAAKHGENGSTLAGFDIQTIGKQLAYIVRGETKFKNFKKNKTTGGVSVTFLGENVATGLKIEDQISVGKRLTLIGSTGTIRSQGDMAYGANLEARFKEKDFPIGQDQSTLGLSLMKWRGDLALGANLQSQFSIGRSSKMSVRVGLNNKLSGQITVRTSSSEQLQLALVGILPLAISIYRSIWPDASESFSAY